jgi:hypothetical protein
LRPGQLDHLPLDEAGSAAARTRSQLQFRHGELALPALWVAAAGDGAVLGLPSVDGFVRLMPPLPQVCGEPHRLLRHRQTA